MPKLLIITATVVDIHRIDPAFELHKADDIPGIWDKLLQQVIEKTVNDKQ